MKTQALALGALAACLFGSAGCKKAQAPPPPGAVQMAGVNLDLPKLEQEFQTASTEARSAVSQIRRLFRSGRLVTMLQELDKLSDDPSLTESQKKVVSDVIEQTRQVLTKIPTPPG